MPSTKARILVPGTLYAGNGMRLTGAGPDVLTDQMVDALPCKTIVSGAPLKDGEAGLALEDRVWVLPDQLDLPVRLPTTLMSQLASLIGSGGKVGLASRSQLACDQARDMLMLALGKPSGEA